MIIGHGQLMQYYKNSKEGVLKKVFVFVNERYKLHFLSNWNLFVIKFFFQIKVIENWKNIQEKYIFTYFKYTFNNLFTNLEFKRGLIMVFILCTCLVWACLYNN